MFPSFFNYSTCLTTVPGEWEKASREFSRVGLNVSKFQSIPHSKGPHQSFNVSEAAILRHFLAAGVDSFLHLEDDCIFQSLREIGIALNELPENWDMVYLGANLIGDDKRNWKKPERISKHLWKIYGAWTTHAVGYSHRIVHKILKDIPDPSECMYDYYLSEKIIPFNNVFVVSPMCAYQRARKSAIWGCDANYTDIFVQSQTLLK